MRRLIVVMLVLICGAIFLGCYQSNGVTGTGVLVDRELNYTDFTGVEMLTEGKIVIVPSDEYGITLTADDNIIDLVTVYPADGGQQLQFSLDRRRWYRQASVSIEVRMPVLEYLHLDVDIYVSSRRNIDATIKAGFIDIDELIMYIDDASLEIEDLDAARLEVEYYGDELTGKVTCDEIDIGAFRDGLVLEGTAQSVVVETGSNDDVDLSELLVAEAEVILAEESVLELNVTDILTGYVGRDAELNYDDVEGLDATELEYYEDESAEEVLE